MITRGAEAYLNECGVNPCSLLIRHEMCDWSDMNEVSRKENEIALDRGDRILSSYFVQGERVWIITEYDRSSTTILLPDEY